MGSPSSRLLPTHAAQPDHNAPSKSASALPLRLQPRFGTAATQGGTRRDIEWGRFGRRQPVTAYELIARGEIRTVHIGRSCWVPFAELEAYVSRLQDTDGPSRW